MDKEAGKKIRPPAGFFLRGAALILLSYLSDVTTWKTNEGAICLRKEGSILVEEDRPEKYTTRRTIRGLVGSVFS